LSIIFVFLSFAQKDDFPILKGPYLGQKPPGMKAERFAPGLLSTNKYCFRLHGFSPSYF